ncbi:methyltransferase [Modestobacter sp. VKM Ac-2979]|uniref:methyltransferase n=1 Tax=unclassified Modestobacter TaxID=2643866 RepID=UPI0022ABBC88|nr:MULTISPECIES: methyltransferase [unclassified Modestobacter]MCZ2812341.1 methyltransferase [Modestobacter sp. VKM Ac-2979]MCZ2841231.1 methyltransferase [Modestobacter sp. VKM Ac-2980]
MPPTVPSVAVETATPIRQARPDAVSGSPTLLRDVGSGYRDGAEEALLELVRGSEDRGSLNEELHSRAVGWAERYHLDRQRANVLRAFEVGAATRVLEVGAGCGAMSRYLAEECAVVDALEPVPARAAVAAARLADRPGARVFTGELADLPDEPAYDLVVVIGVLEYVGGGTADEAPYLAFLDDIRRRLLPGGRLLLAIENKLGVKYLAGSPEDHSDRAYDSLEDYPIGSPARTFDRAALGSLFQRAGMDPTFFSAFPDYKLTRAVIADELMVHPSGLAGRLPRFPSPDWQTARDFGPNEELLWRTLVSAGQGKEHGNSFVVVGTPDGSQQDLWPTDRRAAFYTTERRPGRATESVIRQDGTGLVLERSVLGDRRESAGPAHRVTSGPILPGSSLVDEIAKGDVEFTRRALTEWRELVEASAAEPDGVAVDLVPHNLLVDEDGGLVHIDDEWRSTEWTVDEVVARGLIWLCERLSTVPTPWQTRPSRRALLDELAALVDTHLDEERLSRTLHREAVLQTELLRCGRDDEAFAAEVERTEGELAGLLDHPMSPLRPKLGPLIAERDQARAEVAQLRSEAEQAQRLEAQLHDEVARTHAALEVTVQELTGIKESGGYRALARGRVVAGRVVPRGSVRRSVIGGVLDAVRRRVR